VISGADGASEVKNISWQSWGGGKAIGHGQALYVSANTTSSQAKFAAATVVAFKLGSCSGRPAYTGFEWYFPQHGGKINTKTYLNACTGTGGGL
jgi:hypothetical protein